MDEPVVSDDSPKNDDGTGEVDDLNSVPTKTMEKGNLINSVLFIVFMLLLIHLKLLWACCLLNDYIRHENFLKKYYKYLLYLSSKKYIWLIFGIYLFKP